MKPRLTAEQKTMLLEAVTRAIGGCTDNVERAKFEQIKTKDYSRHSTYIADGELRIANWKVIEDFIKKTL